MVRSYCYFLSNIFSLRFNEIYHWIKMNLFLMIKLYRISSCTINASYVYSSSSLSKTLYCLYETMIVDLIVSCFLFARDETRFNLEECIFSILMPFWIINYRKDELQSDYNFIVRLFTPARDKCAVNKIMSALISRRIIYNRICHGQRACLHARLSRELCIYKGVIFLQCIWEIRRDIKN